MKAERSRRGWWLQLESVDKRVGVKLSFYCMDDEMYNDLCAMYSVRVISVGYR
jgi:hypothetical protein